MSGIHPSSPFSTRPGLAALEVGSGRKRNGRSGERKSPKRMGMANGSSRVVCRHSSNRALKRPGERYKNQGL
jgi:hypothetical protein